MNHDIFEMKTFWCGRDGKVMISCLDLHSIANTKLSIFQFEWICATETKTFENDDCDDR